VTQTAILLYSPQSSHFHFPCLAPV